MNDNAGLLSRLLMGQGHGAPQSYLPPMSERLMTETLLPRVSGPEFEVRSRLGAPNLLAEALAPDKFHGASLLDRFKWAGTPEGGASLAMALLGGARGVGRPSQTYTRIPDSPPPSLRDRYWYELYTASGGKDVSRIKLTPERIEAAKERILSRRSPAINEPYRFRPHSASAEDFASRASAAGHKVSVKYPDGPTGSAYVRVGDYGTIRFADHAAPTDPRTGQVVGGYSTTLRRRHGPAQMSVAPGDSTLDDAFGWLNSLARSARGASQRPGP